MSLAFGDPPDMAATIASLLALETWPLAEVEHETALVGMASPSLPQIVRGTARPLLEHAESRYWGSCCRPRSNWNNHQVLAHIEPVPFSSKMSWIDARLMTRAFWPISEAARGREFRRAFPLTPSSHLWTNDEDFLP